MGLWVVFVWFPCRDSGDCLVLVLSILRWLSIGVPGWVAMVSKLRRGVRGSRVKSVKKESWRVRYRLGERMGRVNSAQSRMCGRGGVAGAASMTSQQLCVGSTGRRSRKEWRMVRSSFDVKLEEDGKSRQEIRSFGPGLKP